MPFGLMLLCKFCVEQQISFCLSISSLSLHSRFIFVLQKVYVLSYIRIPFQTLFFFSFLINQPAMFFSLNAEGCDTFDRSTPQLF